MKKLLVYSAICTVMMVIANTAWSQAIGDTATQEHQILTSIARYPRDLRSAILTVSQYPQVLVKLERIQARSSQSFQDLISPYSRQEQQSFYEMSRYPDRLNQLVRDGKKNSLESRRYLEDLPIDTRSRISDLNDAHFGDLVRMNDIYQRSEADMKLTLAEFPPQVQSDFQKVVAKPEAMSLLTENIDLTMSLGYDYQANPDQVIRQLDSLSGDLTSQDEKDLTLYRQEVQNNPTLQKEMINASDSFSSTYADGDTTPPPVQTDMSGQAPVVNNYYYNNYNPYPYWFSYPYWYATPIWYPRPYWYHTGFYYGPGGAIIVFGLPSPVYTSWFYSYGYRRYPYLYHHCYTYYHQYQRHVAEGYRGNYRSNGDAYSRNRGASGNRYRPVTRNNGDMRNNSRSSNSNTNISRPQIPANRSGWRSIQNNNRPSRQLNLSTPNSRTWQHGGGNRGVIGGGGGGSRNMSGNGGGSGHISGAGHISGGGHGGGGGRSGGGGGRRGR